MSTDKIYFILMGIWIGLNILVTLFSFLTGKCTKKSLKQIFANIAILKEERKLVKGQVIPVTEIVEYCNNFQELCVKGLVSKDDYITMFNYIANLSQYFKNEAENDSNST